MCVAEKHGSCAMCCMSVPELIQLGCQSTDTHPHSYRHLSLGWLVASMPVRSWHSSITLFLPRIEKQSCGNHVGGLKMQFLQQKTCSGSPRIPHRDLLLINLHAMPCIAIVHCCCTSLLTPHP